MLETPFKERVNILEEHLIWIKKNDHVILTEQMLEIQSNQISEISSQVKTILKCRWMLMNMTKGLNNL